MKILLATALFLSTVTGLTFETDYSLDERDPALDPPVYLELELLRVGIGGLGWWRPESFLGPRAEARVLHLGVEVHRFRAGIALADGTTTSYEGSILPVSVGYTLYEQPTRIAGRLYGKRRELYIEATARWAFTSYMSPPYVLYGGTLEAVGSADYGAGASVAVGLEFTRKSSYTSGSPAYNEFHPYIGLRLQLPVLRVGF